MQIKKEGDKINKPINISKTKLKMLRALKEGEIISGEELSKELFISRTAVWKNIQSLQQLGYQIDSIPGKGYCLTNIPDLLYPWELNLDELGFSNIYYFDKIDSTNKFAANVNPPTLVFAETQELGQGRLNREWISTRGGIYTSLVLKPEVSFTKLPALSLVVAVALAETLRELYNLNGSIKWPNDIMVDNKKVSGVLIEASGEMDEISKVIIGIGINVNQKKSDFPYELKNEVTTIKEELSREVDRRNLVNHIISNVINKITSFEVNSTKVLNTWKRYSCTIGKEVVVTGLKEGKINGKAVDIDDDGALIIEKRKGNQMKITSGDVTLRLN